MPNHNNPITAARQANAATAQSAHALYQTLGRYAYTSKDNQMKGYLKKMNDNFSSNKQGVMKTLQASIQALEQVQQKQQAIQTTSMQLRSTQISALIEKADAIDGAILSTPIEERAQAIEDFDLELEPEEDAFIRLNACRYGEKDNKIFFYIREQQRALDAASTPQQKQHIIAELQKTAEALEAVQPQQQFIKARVERLQESQMSRMGMSKKHTAIDAAMEKLSIPDRIEALSDLDSPLAHDLKAALEQRGNPFKRTEATSSKAFKEKFTAAKTAAQKASTEETKEEQQDTADDGPKKTGFDMSSF